MLSSFSVVKFVWTLLPNKSLTMGLLQLLPACGLLEVVCVFIFAYLSFHANAEQQKDNGVGENIHHRSYFLYQQQEYPQDCKDVQNDCFHSSNSSGVFTIRPDGYPEPFEVYCDNEFTLGGWMVIQRRTDGSIYFNRDWQEYKHGFGFLSSSFWLGMEKLSYFTNQAKYQLRIDIELPNGTPLFASYDAFRISDEWSQYRIVSVGHFHGNIDLSCPPNMVFGNCSCQPSCDDPSGVNSCNNNCDAMTEECVCRSGFLMKDGNCVLPSECGCFLTQTDSVLRPGDTHINEDCSKKCTCSDGALSCDSNYACGPNATCEVLNNVRGCYCNVGYEGDGETCTVVFRDCYDAYEAGHRQDGVYRILPTGWPSTPFNVSCDMTTVGGGWTLFQRRTDGVTNFYRNWTEYTQGFGCVQEGKDFWLGNEQIHYLTNQKSYKLRVDIVDSGGASHYGEYTTFETGDETTKYRLSITDHSGNTHDGMQYADGASFSTYDQDNDGCPHQDCAKGHRGGWWYKPYPGWCTTCWYSYSWCNHFETGRSCTNKCTPSNLNGNYNGDNGETINWYHNYYCNLNLVEMKIRPSSV